MSLRVALLCASGLLGGCIIFDQKSEAVVFHQLLVPAPDVTAPDAGGPPVFIPRALVPAALRRPNVVLLDDAGWVHVEDAHRWVAPLDRAVPETVARHLRNRAGVITTTQTPAEDHRVLLLTVDKMEISAPAAAERSLFFTLPVVADQPATATLQITCRLEHSDGRLIAAKTLARSAPLKERTAGAFVAAQSANLATLAGEIASWLRVPATPSSK